MPTMADITVKKADGVTNITFTALTPSAGDSVPAQWRENGASVPAARPVASMRSQFNGPRDARKVYINGKFPYMDPVSGQLLANVPWSYEVTIPLSIPSSVSDEAIAQSGNLIVSTLMRDALKSGYAPT